ncbi:MAG TPA: polyketide synthase dehydratase domain-containing protein, partial [Solirubrobacterales bacterium]|nr:polyketide synthase dehydratase domain-containing protein [Solirubrobacterales bacterium]
GPGASDPAAIGQSDPGHPFLASLIALPGEEGWLATGRVSRREHPWLADHVLLGAAVLPGTAFLELGLKAAEIAGAGCLADLAIEAPMVIPEQGALALQLRIGAGDEQGRRPLEIHSRPDSDAEWTRHASGSISEQGPPPPEPIDAWPPPGAEQLEVPSFYERAAELGIDYGPAFQGLKAAWRRGEELFAEVELDPETAAEAGSFAVHPALLDAAVQTGLAGGGEGEELRIPFSWEAVRLDRGGAAALRVRLSGGGEQPAMVLATATGEPVVSIGTLAARPVDPAALRSAAGGAAASLYRVDWQELDLPEGPEPEDGPAAIRLQGDPELDPPSAARAVCAEVLASLQEAIASERQADPIAFLAEGAVAAVAADVPDPALAAAWALVRSAQAEHPGRFALIDSDGSEASEAALAAALAIEGETEIALRGGSALVPRLARAPEPERSAPAHDP